MFGYIYCVINLINDKFYIGKKYGNYDSSYYGSGKIIKESIQKYGLINFKIYKICDCFDEKDINEKEIYYIDLLKPNYNIAKGGTGGNTLLFYGEQDKKQIIKKRASSLSANWKNKTLEERKEWGNKISFSKKGKTYNRIGYHHSPEVIERIKESNKKTAEKRTSDWFQNHKKAAEKRKGIPNKKAYKSVEILGVVYESFKEASLRLNVSRVTINNWVKKGKGKLIC